MRRRGFTLPEVTVSALVGGIVLAALYAALVHVARGWRRTDAGVVRSQVAQALLDRLADDLAHTDGVAEPTRPMLDAAHWPLPPIAWDPATRLGAHIINRFQVGTIPPTHSLLTPFEQRNAFAGTPQHPVPVTDGCRYLAVDPRSLKIGIDPFLCTLAVQAVVVSSRPTMTFLSLSLGRGMEDDQVLWAFFRGDHDPQPKGTILRVSEREGVVDMTAKCRMIGEVDVRDQWLWVRRPSGIEGGEPFELLMETRLEVPPGDDVPGDPGYRTQRTMTAGL